MPRPFFLAVFSLHSNPAIIYCKYLFWTHSQQQTVSLNRGFSLYRFITNKSHSLSKYMFLIFLTPSPELTNLHDKNQKLVISGVQCPSWRIWRRANAELSWTWVHHHQCHKQHRLIGANFSKELLNGLLMQFTFPSMWWNYDHCTEAVVWSMDKFPKRLQHFLSEETTLIAFINYYYIVWIYTIYLYANLLKTHQ